VKRGYSQGYTFPPILNPEFMQRGAGKVEVKVGVPGGGAIYHFIRWDAERGKILINPSGEVKAGPYMVEVNLVNHLTSLTRKYQMQIEVVGDGKPIQEGEKGTSNPIPKNPEEDENSEG
jgi:hypothetical protein